MTDSMQIAREMILAPAGLTDHDLERLLGQLTNAAVDAADIYFQSSRLQSWVLEDSIIKNGSFSIEQGAGLRAVSGEKTGFAYSDELEFAILFEAATTARAIASSGQSAQVKIAPVANSRQLYPPINPIDSLPDADKVALLQRVDAEARRLDPRVQQVSASVVATQDTVLVLAADGSLAADVRPLIRLSVSVIALYSHRQEV